jgi:hypothetical protein
LFLGTYLANGDSVSGGLTWKSLSLGSINEAYPAFGVEAERNSDYQPGYAKIRLPATNGHNEEHYAYWKANDDGSYSIVGYDSQIE